MRIILSILIVIFSIFNSYSQILNIPPRNIASQNGTQIINSIKNLSQQDRENYIFDQIINGNIPDFLRNLQEINDSQIINSTYINIKYYVTPDYMALGCDSDYFLCPMTPILAQKIADSLNCILPTKKIVDKISQTATVNMQPQTIQPSSQMVTVPVFAEHDSMVWSQRQTFFPANPLGNLVDGDKKDVVISNLIYSSQPPRRVVIYGWHYPNGDIIQPLYSGHIDTYADYSHGIRLIQNMVYIDGDTMFADNILMSQTYNSLLSDEGVIAIPYYPDTTSNTVSIPNVPKSFCLTNNNSTSVHIKILYDNNVDNYHVSTSTDCINWGCAMITDTNEFDILGLTPDSIIYIMLAAENSEGTSNFSEVLACVPSSNQHKILIVNGFDRASAGNTYNFIRQHGKAIVNYGLPFSSATNNAILDSIIDINNFEISDYILGEESSVDETFNNNEQAIIKNYLNNGGKLFVSGSEIAWDLDYLGDSSDKYFYNNYLKAQYVYDAPNNQSATFYEFNDLNNSIFSGLGNTFFDNGNNGTYNVDYPDVINGINGGINGLQYSNLTNNFAGVYFKGIFPNGTDTGKIVNLGFPFETVYPENKRFTLMSMIINFFDNSLTNTNNKATDLKNVIYPNPAKTIININLNDIKEVKVFDIYGKRVKNILLSDNKNKINIDKLNTGIYLIKIKTTKKIITSKFIKL